MLNHVVVSPGGECDPLIRALIEEKDTLICSVRNGVLIRLTPPMEVELKVCLNGKRG